MKIIQRAFAFIIFVLILGTIFVGNTRPIDDGDTWWQMAYGKYMVENATLIPDHTAFSWTPARSNDIYCAWISEIGLYYFHEAFGIIGLQILRYIAILLSVMLFMWYALKRKVLFHPIVGLTMIFATLTYSISSASLIKPEMVTFLFMVLLVYLWWQIRNDKGGKLWKVYMIPVIMLIWVNSHGGFIMAAPFLAFVLIGDFLNSKMNSDEALPASVRKHLFISIVLSGLTVFVTPYGWRYPVYLVQSLFGSNANYDHFATIAAFGSPLSTPIYLLYFIFSISLIVYTFIVSYNKKKIDWVFILTNIIYAVIFTIYNRTIFYWVPVYCFSIIYHIASDRLFLDEKWKKVQYIVYVIVLLLSLGNVYYVMRTRVFEPTANEWFGFGNSYINAEEEVAFVENLLPNARIGNDYDMGGYLLWRIWPKNKVMIDPRYFPYKEWYGDYLKLMSGESVDPFFQKFPCDVMIVEYKNSNTYMQMLKSPRWRPALYSNHGIVFLNRNVSNPAKRLQHGSQIYQCHNVIRSSNIVQFALLVGDFNIAKKIIGQMKEKFSRFERERTVVTASERLFKGYAFYYQHKFDQSLKFMQSLAGTNLFKPSMDFVHKMYHYKTLSLWKEEKYVESLKYANKVLELRNDDLYATYNQGIIQWYLNSSKTSLTSNDKNAVKKYLSEKIWRDPLMKFITATKDIPAANLPRNIAEAILKGNFKSKPILISPPKPILINITEGSKKAVK